jgi:hypothetical protein
VRALTPHGCARPRSIGIARWPSGQRTVSQSYSGSLGQIDPWLTLRRQRATGTLECLSGVSWVTALADLVLVPLLPSCASPLRAGPPGSLVCRRARSLYCTQGLALALANRRRARFVDSAQGRAAASRRRCRRCWQRAPPLPPCRAPAGALFVAAAGPSAPPLRRRLIDTMSAWQDQIYSESLPLIEKLGLLARCEVRLSARCGLPSDAYGSGGGGVLALMLVPTLLATAVRTSGHS